MISCAVSCVAQEADGNKFNLNADKGLPSNHTYSIMKDRYGYLWIATTNGVARYNGYEFKVFNLSDGLPTEDIWEMFEDKIGRIWLGNISTEMGYLFNNKYHKAFFRVNNNNNTIYPHDFRNYNDGIIFHSSYFGGHSIPAICVEKKDTIDQHELASIFEPFVNKNEMPQFFDKVYIDEKGKTVVLQDSVIYELNITANHIDTFKKCTLKEINNISLLKYADEKSFLINNYLVLYFINQKKDFIYVANIRTGEAKCISISNYVSKNETVLHVYNNVYDSSNKNFFIITTKHILEFSVENDINYVRTYRIKDFVTDSTVDGHKIFTFYKDHFWGQCIGSTTNGIDINYNTKNEFKKIHNTALLNCTYIGNSGDSVAIWWDKVGLKTITVDSRFNIATKPQNYIKDIYNLIHNCKNTALIESATFFNILADRNLPVNSCLPELIKYTIPESPHLFYLINNFGFYKVKFESGKVVRKCIGSDRFKQLVFDSTRNSYWAYNQDKVHIHNTIKDTIIGYENLLRFGIRKIETIAIDNKYGNIFCKGNLKGNYKITMYDFEKNAYTELFRYYNLQESKILIYKNTLIVAGQFGIIYSRITGRNQISEPVIYRNIKNINYKHVNNLTAIAGKVILNTDLGLYAVNIPDETDFSENNLAKAASDYKFILNYRDSLISLKPNDTITILPKNQKLQFDIINPFGNGKLRFVYKLADGSEKELNSNELSLPQLPPDNYYTLSLIAYDNVWKSNPINITLYIKPLWWQSHTARRALWASAILLTLLLFSSSVLITRKIVLNKAKKRNLRMELELRSIYAQINPHFIFNSLNSALLLVSRNKMDEAYVHISKFSKLLRSYIKSSRNRLITIEEEIINLRNYIELQQVRFKDKFEYRITLDSGTEINDVKIPSLLLQPFVENAINHGLLPKKGQGNLIIHFSSQKEEDLITCRVEDDGIGRQHAKLIKESTEIADESYGDLLITDLVEIFRKYEQMDIDIQYTDKVLPQNGTIVTIKIKHSKNA